MLSHPSFLPSLSATTPLTLHCIDPGLHAETPVHTPLNTRVGRRCCHCTQIFLTCPSSAGVHLLMLILHFSRTCLPNLSFPWIHRSCGFAILPCVDSCPSTTPSIPTHIDPHHRWLCHLHNRLTTPSPLYTTSHKHLPVSGKENKNPNNYDLDHQRKLKQWLAAGFRHLVVGHITLYRQLTVH